MKKFKNVLLAACTIGMLGLTSNVYAWDGTQTIEPTQKDGDVYVIKSAEELKWFANEVKTNPNINVKLGADIDLENHKWIPIGEGEAYLGNFNGNGKTITNLTVDNNTLNTGFFEYNKGMIDNFTLKGNVTGNGNYTGALVGKNEGTIKNITADVNLTNKKANSTTIGGIAGSSEEKSVIISTNYNGVIDVATKSSKNIGGIVGSANSSKIIGNKSDATINTTDTAATFAGGIVGRAEFAAIGGKLDIYNNIYSGIINSKSSNASIGGIAGIIQVKKDNSYLTMVNNITTNFESFNLGAVKVKDTLVSTFNVENVPNHSEDKSNNFVVGTITDYENGIVSKEDLTSQDFIDRLNNYKGQNNDLELEVKYNLNSDGTIGTKSTNQGSQTTDPVVEQDKDVVAFESLVSKLPNEITLEDTQNVKAAQNAYEALSDQQKALVKADTVKTMNNAIERIATLEKEKTEKEAQQKTDQEYIDAAIKKLESNSYLKIPSPTYGKDTNAIQVLKDELERIGYGQIEVKMIENLNPEYVSENGELTYFYTDPSKSSINLTYNRAKLSFEFKKGDAKAEFKNKLLDIGWDLDKLDAFLQDNIVNEISENTILNNNSDLNNVTEDLALPIYLSKDKTFGKLAYTSSDTTIINPVEGKKDSVIKGLPDWIGKVKRANEDKNVKLTVSVNYMKLNNWENNHVITKEFNINVKGLGNSIDQEMQQIFDQYITVDKFKVYSDTYKTMDLNNIKYDFGFINTKDFGMSGDMMNTYKVFAKAPESQYIKANGTRFDIRRPSVGSKPVKTKFYVELTNTKHEIKKQKEFEITIQPLTQAEIDAEVALMNQVKENYFNGINNGANPDKDSITKKLSAFISVKKDGNNLKWFYNNEEAKKYNSGIRVEGPEEGYTGREDRDRYISSNPRVIEHESLVVNTEEYNKVVKISSWLTSMEYGKYASMYPENKQLQQLYKNPIEQKVMVLGTKGILDPNDPDKDYDVANNVRVKVESDQETLMPSTVVNAKIEDLSKIFGGSDFKWKTPKPVLMHALVQALQANKKDPSDKNVLGSKTGSFIETILGKTGAGQDGWMYAINNQLPMGSGASVDINSVKENDVITFFYKTGSNMFSYFDKESQTVKQGSDIKLVLNKTNTDGNMDTTNVEPIEGAKIQIINLSNNKRIANNYVSNKNGEFNFNLKEIANYQIVAQAQGITRTTTLVNVVKDDSSVEKPKAVKNVETILDSLPLEGTIENKAQFTKALELYNKLSDKEKALVDPNTLTKLNDGLKQIKNLENKKAAENKAKQEAANKAKVEKAKQEAANKAKAKKAKALPKYKTVKKGNTTTSYVLNSKKKYIVTKSVYKKGNTTTTKTYQIKNNKSYIKTNKTVKRIKKKNITTYSYVRSYYSNMKTKKLSINKKSTKNKWTSKKMTAYYSNGKKKQYISYSYKKGKTTKRVEYRYNKKGQTKSNKYGKAYRYNTTYKKGKAKKTTCQQYNKKGKLAKAKKVKLRR